MIKAILCDIEGTLVSGTGILDEETAAELRSAFKILKENRTIGLITGRELKGTENVDADFRYKQFKLNGPVIVENGAVIYPYYSEDENGYVQVGGLNEINIEALKEILVDNGFMERMKFDPNKNFMVTLYMHGFPEVGFTDLDLYEKAAKLIPDEFDVTYSSASIDVSTKGTNKGNAIRTFAEMHGLRLNEIAVFGDSKNDETMFRVVLESGGLGFFVGGDEKMAEWVRSFDRGYADNKHLGVRGTLHYLKNFAGYETRP